MAPLKDEQIVLIAPGSETTLAQLGLPESYTPAKVRIPTRMFPAETEAQWEPHKIRQKKVAKPEGPADNAPKETDANGDVDMADAGGAVKSDGQTATKEEDEILYEEDLHSDEGAVYPIQSGYITDMPCLLALLTHVYKTLNPPFNASIILVAQPAWTTKDQEELTSFVFETFKPPAFCLIDSALAVSYAYGVPTATVVDVGFEKSDVTAVSEYTTQTVGRGIAVPNCGGDAMTTRLLELLEPKGWTKAMCEQLKKSNICEILPQGTPLPGSAETASQPVTNPAAAASTGAIGSGPGQRKDAAALGEAPRGPGPDTDVGDDEQEGLQINESEDGVLDVASLVASGKMKEYLAQKEREKALKAADKAADKAARKAAADSAAATARAGKLPNARREKNTFNFEERRSADDDAKNENGKRTAETEVPDVSSKRQKSPDRENAEAEANGANGTEEAPPVDEESESARRQHEKAVRKEERRIKKQVQSGIIRRELEVGIERFRAASGGNIEILADAIYRTVLAVPDPRRRSDLWDSLVIVGNGSRVKGFKEALISTLNSKYLISPSSATMFTSELPSNLSTPLATGANTPQPQIAGMPQLGGGGGSGVNPLLLAATTASNPQLNPSGMSSSAMSQQFGPHVHSSHGQTPTSIKQAKVPEFFPEWKDVGFEEAAFLGAQVAAKVVFVIDQGNTRGYMSRTEYNDSGPTGIRESRLC